MSTVNSPSQDDDEPRLRAALSAATEAPSVSHDDAVLAAARAYAAERRATRTMPAARLPRALRWFVPASLAASLALGVLVGRLIEPIGERSTPSALHVPLETTRGGAARSIPVEQADPDLWYRYIQELVAAGERREAEAHLERFNALHPDYVYQP